MRTAPRARLTGRLANTTADRTIGGSLVRVRRRLIVALAAVAASATAGLALAEVEDRVVLRATGGNDLEHYSPTLAAVAVSPPEYARGCCYDSDGGEWTGPRYQATGLASLGGDSKVDWSVGVAVRTRDTRAALIANLTHDWPVVSEGEQPVEHRVAGRAAGTIGGYWVLTRSPFGGADDARMEAAVGFPLCDGNTAYAKFSLLLPSGNSAGGSIGFGEYVINGMRPSDWNAAKAMQSIRRVRLEGNRPATRVTSTAGRGRVSGSVADCDAHPLAGLTVQLERRSGGSWRTVSSARTAADGTYSLAASSAGTYRVRAGTRTSAPVRIGGGAPAPGAPPQGTATGTVLVDGRPFTSGPIPFGSTVDVSAGRLTLKADVGTLAVYGTGRITAKFVPRRATEVVNGTRRPLIELALAGGDFGPCGERTPAGRLQQGKPKEVRALWGNGKGSFRTKGRFASAGVRGTIWRTTDRCDGTLTTVRQGTVSVRDFTRNRTVTVRAGRSYLAPARRP